MTYDPHFDQTKRPKPNHECVFVQSAHRYFEFCEVPGCSEGRYSRRWIEHMKAPSGRRSCSGGE